MVCCLSIIASIVNRRAINIEGMPQILRRENIMTGNFATSKAGHDKDKCYVIVREEGDFVYLSDGRLKPFAAPKKKRKKHIQIINRTVSDEILSRLLNIEKGGSDTVRDEEIKYEIKQYMKRLQL